MYSTNVLIRGPLAPGLGSVDPGHKFAYGRMYGKRQVSFSYFHHGLTRCLISALPLSFSRYFVTTAAQLTGAEVHAGQKTPHPGRFALAFAEIRDELAEEYAERVRDPVHHHVAHEAGEHDHPTVTAVRRRRQVVVFAKRYAVVVGGVLHGSHGQRRGAGVLPVRFVDPVGGRTFAFRLQKKKNGNPTELNQNKKQKIVIQRRLLRSCTRRWRWVYGRFPSLAMDENDEGRGGGGKQRCLRSVYTLTRFRRWRVSCRSGAPDDAT